MRARSKWYLGLVVFASALLATTDAGAQRSVAAVASQDGRLEVFLARPGAGVFHVWQPRVESGPEAWDWSPWARHEPAPSGGGVVATRDGEGRLVAAWLSGGSIWVAAASAPGGALQSPRRLDTSELASLAVEVNQDGRVEFLALNIRGQLWSVAQSQAGSWDDVNIHYLEGHDLRQVATTVTGDGRLAVFALGSDGKAYWIAQQAPNAGWGPWSGLEGESLKALAGGANADGRLEVVALGGDGALYHRYQNVGGGWSGWEFLAKGPVAGPITLARNSDGRLELFARRSANHHVTHIWQTAPNAKWADDLSDLSAVIGTLPDDQVVTMQEGRLALVTAGTASCLVAVTAQEVPNGSFVGWPGVPSPCPPPPPPGPKITAFAANPDYLPVGKATVISWNTSNCGSGCEVSLEGRNDLNYSRVFLKANHLPASGSQSLTPSDTYTRLTLTVSTSGGMDTRQVDVQLYREGTSPTCTGCAWYYFRMKPPSALVSCVTVAYYAKDTQAAKGLAEGEWQGYSATAITYQEFVAGCA